MPNWCKGDLKVRGTKVNIKKFIVEALNPVTYIGDEAEKPQIEEDSFDMTITSKDIFYVKGTRRNFIDSNSITFYFPEGEDEVTVLVLEDYKAAWGIDTEALRKISEEYLIDLKILGFEQGQEFNQDIEIIQGSIIKDNEITFDDYKWECIRPHIGG